MIFRNQENIRYLHFKKGEILRKKGEKTYTLLQIYNNNLVDNLIDAYFNNDPIGKDDSFEIYETIYNINKGPTKNKFNQEMNKNPLINQDKSDRLSNHFLVDEIIQNITKEETKGILKNLEYVKEVIKNTELDYKQYVNIKRKLRPTVSRKEILERSLKTGKMYNNRELSYKEIKNLARDLESYKDNKVNHEVIQKINQESIEYGNDYYYRQKVWIWSGLENTRHSDMDNETVHILDKFEVINENTDEIDYLDYPVDIENYTNPSNIINCACNIEYIK